MISLFAEGSDWDAKRDKTVVQVTRCQVFPDSLSAGHLRTTMYFSF
jgi:hypothetical protein